MKSQDKDEFVDDIRMSNFSQIISMLFVTIVLFLLFIKILFY